jgi:hypothetical protein
MNRSTAPDHKPDTGAGKTPTRFVGSPGYTAATLSDPHASQASHLAASDARCKMPTLPPENGRPEPHATDLPAVKSSPRCPNCGTPDVIVFPVAFTGTGPLPRDVQLFCIGCCPKRGGAL